MERFEPISGGRIGVAAIHLATGREAYLNPDESFPMASTCKVPIAVLVKGSDLPTPPAPLQD